MKPMKKHQATMTMRIAAMRAEAGALSVITKRGDPSLVWVVRMKFWREKAMANLPAGWLAGAVTCGRGR